MDTLAESAGRWAAACLFALPALYFLQRALKAVAPSRRLADFAIFCGLMTLVVPEVALGLSPATHALAFVVLGVIRVLLGCGGLLLAGVAFVLRRDGGTGIGRVSVAAMLCGVHIAAGLGLLLFSSFGRPGTPWEYRSPDGLYSIQLPSQQWKQAPTTEETNLVAFVHPLPRMQARVLQALPNQTEGTFIERCEAFRQFSESKSGTMKDIDRRGGTSVAGLRYQYTTATESTPNGELLFVAHSITWNPKESVVVELLFEGLPRMRSNAGKAAELAAFEKAAEDICLSVH